MKRKRCFAGILGMILTAGVFLAGCDLTTNPGNKGSSGTSNSGELDGTWKYGSYEIIINGDTYVMKDNGVNYGKGTISYSVANSTFSFRSTHAWTGSGWSPYTETTNGKLTYGGGNTLTISNLDNYTFLAGTWTKQSLSENTGQKTIIISGFPGSAYSGKIAVIMFSPSFESLAAEEVTAVGGGQISGTTLTLPLYTSITASGFGPSWNGTGDFIVMLAVTTSTGDVEKMFLYSDVMPNDTGSNVPRYHITDTVSTIPFTDFIDVSDYM
jgi:hypothetical protein